VATILFTWKLAGGFGHLDRLKPLEESLAAQVDELHDSANSSVCPFFPSSRQVIAPNRSDTLYGDGKWIAKTSKQLGLESTLRPRGRPKKEDHEQ
jgi:hypothetical protein